MQQFIVPQFIDVEPRIIGPITVRQFILMVVGGIFIFLSFRFAGLPLFLLTTAVMAGIVFLFGFLKVNGAPFHEFLLNVMASFKRPSLRVWDKFLTDEEINQLLKKPVDEKIKEEIRRKEKLTGSRLAELSLIVDTRGEYKGE